MKKKSLISVLMSLVLTMCMSVSVFATSFTDPDLLYINKSGSSYDGRPIATEVSATRTSSFSVIIPKTIVLPGSSVDGMHEALYAITVRGDIGSMDDIIVVPDKMFNLRQPNKNDVTAKVTQDAQKFRLGSSNSLNLGSHVQTLSVADLSTGFTSDTGKVSVGSLSPGTWTGTYNYNISFDTRKDPGLYSSSGVLLYTWDELKALKDSYDQTVMDIDNGCMSFSIYQLDSIIDYRDCMLVVSDEVSVLGSIDGEGTSISSIVLPDTITKVDGGDRSFWTAEFVINLPDSVTSISNFGAYGITIRDNHLPDSLTEIGEEAFQGMDFEGMSNIVIPDGVTEIGDHAFYDVINLESVVLPEGLRRIGFESFAQSCWSIRSVTIPSSLEVIDFGDSFSNTYGGCSIEDIYYNGTRAEWDNVMINGSEYVGSSSPFSIDVRCSNLDEVSDSAVIHWKDGSMTVGEYKTQMGME